MRKTGGAMKENIPCNEDSIPCKEENISYKAKFIHTNQSINIKV